MKIVIFKLSKSGQGFNNKKATKLNKNMVKF